MTETQEPRQTEPKPGAKKGVSIQIMFPCESDDKALPLRSSPVEEQTLPSRLEFRVTFA